MKTTSLFVALILIVSFSTSAFAFKCDISYDASKFEITLKGNSQAPFTVIVAPSVDADRISLSSATMVGQYDFTSINNFEEKILLQHSLSSGEYKVSVRANEQYIKAVSGSDRLYGELYDNIVEIDKCIYLISSSDGDQLIHDINAADTESELYMVILTGVSAESGVAYSELISIDSAAFSQYGS